MSDLESKTHERSCISKLKGKNGEELGLCIEASVRYTYSPSYKTDSVKAKKAVMRFFDSPLLGLKNIIVDEVTTVVKHYNLPPVDGGSCREGSAR